ncbi:conserved hypothetical protein [Theileria orientalis strain Shintoku]|uniref:Uncharacterized protein n=1 Tax=Theileria orientalis strain Shintoku TaxID=869250 RepID=J4DPG5_THEOR|nr:conserved hypothetical protein [Theileria orientalis strain Shintoku]BAM40664.1 conserved hypothetical protein [Theileria orientalis strain Shintoku]|eukprot:XP_009690965.1 conserved hypothetical protein [Theileria orientalis strain Shintoku]
MDKSKTRPKRKAPEDYERGITKRTRQIATSVTSRPASSVATRYAHKEGSGTKAAEASKEGGDSGTQRSFDKARHTSTAPSVSRRGSSAGRDADRSESKSGGREKEAGSSGTAATRAQSRPERSEKQRVDVSRLDSKIMELVGSTDADLFKLVYNISVGAVDPGKCVDVIRFYGLGHGMLIFKLLDLVSFFLDVSMKKTNLLYFLQALESLGVNKEIISTIDANKLDNCNYSEGLVKIHIRERTRNNYVLKVFNLYRECPKGFMALITYFSSLSRRKVNKGVEEAGADGTDVDTVCDTIKRITGMYKLCPLRVLYEVLNWLAMGYFNEKFVLGLLSMYNEKQVRFCVLFYLQVNSGGGDKANVGGAGAEDVKESARKESKADGGEAGLSNQGESEATVKASSAEGGINTTCSGIYYLIALLVTTNYLRLEDVYKYLSPPDELIVQLSRHFMSVVRSSSVGTTARADNPVLVDLLKSASFYTICSEYLNACKQNSSKAKRVDRMLEIFSDPKYSGFPARDANGLLTMSSYRLLKNCVYACNFPKVALLSNILGLCDDFTGGNWSQCYALIVHLCKLGYCAFFNTSIVHRFNGILTKVLASSSFSTATKNYSAATKVDVAKEWVILKKLEFYFGFVGFRACEDTVLFNRVLRYLYNLLLQLEASPQKLTKSAVKGQKGTADAAASGSRKLKLKVTKIIYKYLLFNVMNCCEGNFQVSDKIWNILKLFTTLERYQIYAKSCHFLTKYKLEAEAQSVLNEDSGTANGSDGAVGSDMRTTYYVNQLYFVRRTHQIYSHKLKNIFKKITGELLKSVKSPTIRSIVSIITAISAINPFSVGTLIIKQSEMFNNLLLPLCELTKYFQAYTIDVFIYQLTVNLLGLIGAGSGGKEGTAGGSGRGIASVSVGGGGIRKNRGEKLSLSSMRLDCNNLMKEDDNNKVNVNSIILCKIFKRHNECDIAPLITVLALLLNYALSNKLDLRHSGSGDLSRPKKATGTAAAVKQVDIQLDSSNYYDLVFRIYKVLDYLVNLFELMNGIIIIDMNKMTNDQLLSQCGSFSLKTESQLMNLDEEVTLSNKKVFKIVSRPFFLHSLMLILGRLLNELVYDSDFGNHKLLVEVVNKYHSVVMLLVEFLSTSTNEATGNNGISRVFLCALSKYYAGNYIDFFRQYLFGGVSATGNALASATAGAATGGEEESVLDEKFVAYVNTLNIYDIFVPVEQYDHYINKLLSHYNQLAPSTRSANGTLMRRLKRIKNRITTLTVDKQAHQAHSSVVLERLKEMLQRFVKNEQKVGPHVTVAFIAKVVYPRVFISVLNSMFCCKLVDLMVLYRVNYFNYFDFVNCYCKLLVPLINYSTEAEVINFSVFFNYSFNMIKSWINSREAFESVVRGNPCFCLTFRFNPEKQFKYEQLLQVLKKWEYLILVSLFSCYTVGGPESRANSRGAGPTGGDLGEGANDEASERGDLDLESVGNVGSEGGEYKEGNEGTGGTQYKESSGGTQYKEGIVGTEGCNPKNSGEKASNPKNSGEKASNPKTNEQKDSKSPIDDEMTGGNSIESITTNNDNASDQDPSAATPDSKGGGRAEGSDPVGGVAEGNGTHTSGNEDSTLSPVNAASGIADGAGAAEPVGRLSSWIEIKNVVIFLNKVSANFPVTHNSSAKVVNFLKSVLKVSKRENWQDVTVSANTLIKTMQMYQNQNKYITLA